MRRWCHELTHLHIHIDWSRNVSWKLAKLQSVISSLFFNWFSSGFHFCLKMFMFSSEIKLNLFRISPLMLLLLGLIMYSSENLSNKFEIYAKCLSLLSICSSSYLHVYYFLSERHLLLELLGEKHCVHVYFFSSLMQKRHRADDEVNNRKVLGKNTWINL